MGIYNRVYDFTNENVTCLKDIYDFKNSRVLSVVGSGDQYFASMLYGAKQVDLFDINVTSYLYLALKFYSIRELNFEEFYELLVLKKFDNISIYNKLEKVLPLEVLKYYKFLIKSSQSNKKNMFRTDGINLLTRKNKKYYFENPDTVIPYFIKEEYYKLKQILKNTDLPKFDKIEITTLKPQKSYDILLTSNIYQNSYIDVFEFVKQLRKMDIPQIQAGYDWYGDYLEQFNFLECSTNSVLSSSPSEYLTKKNYIYSIKK